MALATFDLIVLGASCGVCVFGILAILWFCRAKKGKQSLANTNPGAESSNQKLGHNTDPTDTAKSEKRVTLTLPTSYEDYASAVGLQILTVHCGQEEEDEETNSDHRLEYLTYEGPTTENVYYPDGLSQGQLYQPIPPRRMTKRRPEDEPAPYSSVATNLSSKYDTCIIKHMDVDRTEQYVPLELKTPKKDMVVYDSSVQAQGIIMLDHNQGDFLGMDVDQDEQHQDLLNKEFSEESFLYPCLRIGFEDVHEGGNPTYSNLSASMTQNSSLFSESKGPDRPTPLPRKLTARRVPSIHEYAEMIDYSKCGPTSHDCNGVPLTGPVITVYQGEEDGSHEVRVEIEPCYEVAPICGPNPILASSSSSLKAQPSCYQSAIPPPSPAPQRRGLKKPPPEYSQVRHSKLFSELRATLSERVKGHTTPTPSSQNEPSSLPSSSPSCRFLIGYDYAKLHGQPSPLSRHALSSQESIPKKNLPSDSLPVPHSPLTEDCF